ncbi:hypothetical protein [Flavihumibacter sp. ZG627]|uniref:hypothetical protein n=1 Tax=Flavihumibacter sp. ZG627 TaxID=1463156 RepID=UPI00057E991E|nr:hypothetical protein [Flavihumibacter sp. ZG627]KIC91113.1 hypothetical protein HY58_08895 [Flavihumibacter sp. ZG627]
MTVRSSPFYELQKLYRILLYAQIGIGILGIALIQFNLLKPIASVSVDRMLQVITVIYSFAAVIVGMQLFRRRVESIRSDDNAVRIKLAAYKSAAMLQWYLLLGASVFCMVSYVITANWSFLGLTIMILAIFGGLNPFKQKVMLQLRLSDQDVAGI